jgi:hypothetical protein
VEISLVVNQNHEHRHADNEQAQQHAAPVDARGNLCCIPTVNVASIADWSGEGVAWQPHAVVD